MVHGVDNTYMPRYTTHAYLYLVLVRVSCNMAIFASEIVLIVFFYSVNTGISSSLVSFHPRLTDYETSVNITSANFPTCTCYYVYLDFKDIRVYTSLPFTTHSIRPQYCVRAVFYSMQCFLFRDSRAFHHYSNFTEN